MKWLSRSRKFRWPVHTSGLTISTARAWPRATLLAAVWMPKVADEQATFMSKAKPWIPSACCTSMAIAGYGRCRLEQATITPSTSAAVRPARSRA
ncbi:hypothetical protein D3C75_1012740 [compost metagenome]